MRRRDVHQELAHHAPTALARTPSARPVDRSPGVDPLEPTTRSVLALQNTVGNAAVALALRGMADGGLVVQRQPKPPKKQPTKQPKWVTDAQAVFTAEFPALKGVVIKNYADLNKTLQGAHFAAWTQSKTEIYLKDPTKPAGPKQPAPPKAQQVMFVRYVLEHEAEHIRQFINPGGPPTTWEQMLKFEKDAYERDRLWLSGAGANIITDPDVFDSIEEAVDKNLIDIDAVLTDAKGLSGPALEKALHKGMLAKKLIPSGSDLDPLKLYKQP